MSEYRYYNGDTYIKEGNRWVFYSVGDFNNSFNQLKINNVNNFNSFVDRNINFEGINLHIYSANSNTVVFSAQSISPSINSITSITEYNNVITVNKSDNTSTNLTIDAVTGGSYFNGTITLSGTGGANGVQISGISTASDFTGGTVTGPTNFTNGLSATTISGGTLYGDGSNLTNVQNIYNNDGTISSDRYVNISGNTLWFSGVSQGFQVKIHDGVTKPGFSVLSDSLGGPCLSTYNDGTVLIDGPAQFLNTAQFDSTITINTAALDNYSPYLLGVDLNNQVTTLDSSLLLNSITGGTYSSGSLNLVTNSGETIPIPILFITSVTESANVISIVNSNNQPSAYTIDAVTGGSYSNGTITLSGTGSVNGVQITGFSTSNNFTGGTVSGATNFTNGLSANTVSATTYQNLPTDIRTTGATYSNNNFTFTNNTGGTYSVLFNTITGLTINGNLTVTGTTSTGTISATTYQNLPTDIRTTGATYSNNTFTFTNNTGGTYSVLFNTVTGLTINGNLTVTGTTSSTSFTGSSDTISGSKGSVITNGSTTTAFITFSGNNTVGGVDYVDFIRVTNTAAGATNTNKTIRVNNTGGIEFLNSAYNATILTFGDNGVLNVGGGNTAVTSNNDGSTNYLSFNNNNFQMYDDGNTHIHARGSGNSMWINTNNAAIIMGNQSPVLGGSAASAIIMGSSTTIKAYANIYGSKTYTIGSYGYLAVGGSGTGGGTTAPYSLYCNNRIEATEFDATSDERLKDIEGEIGLDESIELVTKLKPIKYTWKDSEDKGIKAGYSAQQVEKSGFRHLIGHIPNEDLKATTDGDGFTSPEGFQLTMNYDQVTPYHGVVIKHLLEEIESLKQEIKELKNKIG